ncbi:MAG: GNAT family N-acetyltransferase [Phycisphaerae bacterium]|nr:GNAT family N-acetyltransferase [Phycisphaerae bacterium]
MASLPIAVHPMKPSGCCGVRTATPEDAAAVLECARETFRTSMFTLTQADEFTMTLDQERAFLADTLAHPDQAFLIAVDADLPHRPPEPGEVLGALVMRQTTPKRKVRHIVDLGMSVRSSHRSRGVGTALMTEAVRWAESRPELSIITLAVYAANAHARALYRRFGFIQYGMFPDGCKHDDGTTWDQIHMYRRV